jgi:hypothetical protein
MTAVFFFEGETGGLMFVGQRYSQSRQRSSRFAREDTAADYPCSQRGKKRPKLYLLHRGVLRSPTPLTHYNITDVSSLAQKLRQLTIRRVAIGDV